MVNIISLYDIQNSYENRISQFCTSMPHSKEVEECKLYLLFSKVQNHSRDRNITYLGLRYNRKTRAPQKEIDIYLVIRHAPGDYPPTYITTSGISIKDSHI